MSITKPTKPSDEFLPNGFGTSGGVVKNNFSESKILNGFSVNVEDILQGDNLNYMLDAIGKQLNYLTTIVDFINGMPIGKVITTNNNNKLDYADAIDNNKANISLDNLNYIGEAHFANPSLNNLNSTGEARFTGKANISLNNLNSTGEAHFANPSLNNLNSTGKQFIINLLMPDTTAGVSCPHGFVAPSDGWVCISTYNNGGGYIQYVSINGVTVVQQKISTAWTGFTAQIPVSKGDIVDYNQSGTAGNAESDNKFYPMKGAI